MSRANPLQELARFGVSVWYDNISRGLVESGELRRLISEDGLRGVTSNPTIFEAAIGGSQDYDQEIRALAGQTKSSHEIFESLAVSDIRAAADLFRPLYESTEARDGFVSLELPPALARDAQASLREARRLNRLVGRPNVMIKIPGTAEGLAAIEGAIAEGIPINVTLLFSRERYAAVAEAYVKGLERRARRRKDLSAAASVASFFVSRVDTAVDRELDSMELARGASDLRGRAAVANAKLAYQTYKKTFGSARFAALKRLGARPQRLLWASTSAKNPAYRDVVYVEELIGEDTVNTMPPATIAAFRDHGICRPSLDQDAGAARKDLERLSALGVDLEGICRRLEEEGLRLFAESYESLIRQLNAKKELVLAEEKTIDKGLSELKAARFSSRLWAKDASLWKKEQAHQAVIRRSLGWLSLPEAMAAGLGSVRSFAQEAAREGFESAVVLGMGGSSLACEVFRTCFPQGTGRLRLEVLDTTHPAAVEALKDRLALERTLFIVSSKSGSTIEPNALMEYFYAEASKRPGARPGRQFAAITDPGTSLEKKALAMGFRKIFSSPPDVGGRYSALSYFGLVPAALMGVDLELLLGRSREAARSARASTATEENPALRLGAAIGQHAREGRDKLTLCLSPAIETFGLWIEQLVAESTGKEGRGVVPVCGEPLGEPEAYGPDRLFVRLELPGSPDLEASRRLRELERAGHPVITLKLRDAYDLGGEFFLWEVATAAASLLLGVDPFDQPDVQAAKDRTRELLSSLKKGRLPEETPALRAGGLPAFCDPPLSRGLPAPGVLGAGVPPPSKTGCGLPAPGVLGAGVAQVSLAQALEAHLSRLGPGDYCAVLSYLEPGDDNRRELAEIQRQLRRLTTAPVSIEHGPRYLHSTGQLYKGGGGQGLFLQLSQTGSPRLPVPGPFARQGLSFATLLAAQARGDLQAMLSARRRILGLALGPEGAGALRAVARALSELASRRPALKTG